ncbi:hypothetical protein AAFF_G00271870 [Aldrovandia affinis]|uniref:Uncharacterized protein n=1 Tax=Aldrovandia affinis TaxID=143900 RepID=A0AAD7RAS7_9TELE|nr:hypothetical protein AAFF_G00271870 [Aldrovandia affinis]
MPSTQAGSRGVAPPKLHRPFVFYDLEAIAVVAILVGVFQVFLALPLYFLNVGLPLLFVLPLFVGFMFVAAGSFALACEKSPSRRLMKVCAYTNLAGLVGALCALCVYSMCIHSPPTFKPCIVDKTDFFSYHDTGCPEDKTTNFFRLLATLLLIYDIAALILLSLLSFSALKGLRMN